MKPFCAIYSTFLPRAYDQVVHDVALQRLPVRFALDRAGLVGAEGATHTGAFDIVYLGCLPNMVLMAAADEVELMHMVATATAIDDRPCGFRYARGDGLGLASSARGTPLELGRARVLREGTRVAILSYGTRLQECLAAAQELATRGLSCTVADARFAKPLDTALIERLAREHAVFVTVEEGVAGGSRIACDASHCVARTAGQRLQNLSDEAFLLPSSTTTASPGSMTRRGSTRRRSSRQC